MAAASFDIIKELESRGLVSQMTSGDELRTVLAQSRTLYSGFDPTAESLHIGNLVPLLALRRFQLAVIIRGFKRSALDGGNTQGSK